MAIRYQQPQGSVQINWTNPLAPKTGLWVTDRNIVTGKQPTYAGAGNAPRKIITRSGVELFTDGQLVQTDLPAQAFSVLTWCMLFTPAAAPSAATFAAAFQTQQATFNWNHSNASYQGAFTLYANGGFPTCKFVNGFTAGQQVLLHGTYDGTSIRVYRNGVLENTTAASNGTSGVTVESLQFLGGNGGTAPFSGSVAYVSWDTTRALSSAQVRAHADNIYQVFQPQARSLWVAAAAGSGSTGTLARTNAADTSAASGTTTITGTLAKSNSNSTSAAAGTTTVIGSVAKTNSNDSATASGMAGAVTGTAAVTNRNDTSAVFVPVVVANRANEWYGYLRSYEQLNKPKRKYKENEPQAIAAKPAEQPDTRPLLAQQMLAALRTKALKEGAQASHAFIERLRADARVANEQDEEDALMLLFN